MITLPGLPGKFILLKGRMEPGFAGPSGSFSFSGERPGPCLLLMPFHHLRKNLEKWRARRIWFLLQLALEGVNGWIPLSL